MVVEDAKEAEVKLEEAPKPEELAVTGKHEFFSLYHTHSICTVTIEYDLLCNHNNSSIYSKTHSWYITAHPLTSFLVICSKINPIWDHRKQNTQIHTHTNNRPPHEPQQPPMNVMNAFCGTLANALWSHAEKAQSESGNIEEKQTVTQCSKLGENGETVHVSVLTEESHSAMTTGKLLDTL